MAYYDYACGHSIYREGILGTVKFETICPDCCVKDPAMVGPGGAPTRATTLPVDGKERKKFPVATGVLEYFPDAIVAVSHVSWNGNNQHNPGQPLHWSRGKSNDHADTMQRHYLARGTRDVDGQRHSAKMAWRALAILQLEIEAEQKESSHGKDSD